MNKLICVTLNATTPLFSSLPPPLPHLSPSFSFSLSLSSSISLSLFHVSSINFCFSVLLYFFYVLVLSFRQVLYFSPFFLFITLIYFILVSDSSHLRINVIPFLHSASCIPNSMPFLHAI